jgi:hypothetical protein
MANAADIAFRSPKSSIAVLPIFRQDATPIPDYFLNQIMPRIIGVSQLKLALSIFRLMHHAGDDEIITYSTQLSDLSLLRCDTVNHCLRVFRQENIFQIKELGPADQTKGRSSPTLLQIKFVNRVNYTEK